jgi:hypothetical protein
MKTSTEPRTWTDSVDKRLKRQNMDIRFGTRNVRTSPYKLDLVRVLEVRCEGGGIESEGEYIFFYPRAILRLEGLGKLKKIKLCNQE